MSIRTPQSDKTDGPKVKLVQSGTGESAEEAEDQDGLADNAIAFDQQIVGDEVMESVGEVIYSEWKGGLKPYRILKASDENLENWKREIDGMIKLIKEKNVEAIIELMSKRGRSKGDLFTVRKIIEEEILDETDIILFAIGLFVLREKSPWKPIASRLKLLRGGDHKMESFFTRDGDTNCYDTTITVKTLAKLYGIEGDLEGKWIFHSFFATKDGRVSDPMYGWRRAGLFHSREEHARYIQEIRKREGLIGRATAYIKSKEK